MKALFIQGAHMFICAHLLSLHLSLALNPSQQQNSLLEIAAFVPTLKRCVFIPFVKQQLQLLSDVEQTDTLTLF